jgi:hypothetical protein
VLRGMILFSAVLGFGAMTYYVGRSHELVLPTQFPFFAFTVGLLLCVRLDFVPRALLGIALALPLVATRMSPGSEVARLRSHDRSYVEAFEAIRVQEREVLMIYPYADWIALQAGARNVAPFAHRGSIVLHAQVDEVAELAKRFPRVYGAFPPEVVAALTQQGFREVSRIRPPNAVVRAAAWDDFVVYEKTGP